VQVGHAGARGLLLQLAVAAFLAAGAEVVAFDKQHLQQMQAARLQGSVWQLTRCPGDSRA
jgi:hypothetical protein